MRGADTISAQTDAGGFFMATTLYLRTALFTVIALFATPAFSGGATADNDIPRQIGQFQLGMSLTDFVQKTGIQAEPCAICIPGETFVPLDSSQLQKYAPGTNSQGMDFFFFNDSLYHIALTPNVQDLSLTQDAIEQFIGKTGELEETGNGLAQLKWNDPETLVTLNFRPETRESYAINFYDWNLLQERQWRESLLFESTAMSP